MSALFWLLRRSFRNWIVRKVVRLKQPKYALSAAFLGLYFCMMLVPWVVTTSEPTKDPTEPVRSRAYLEAIVSGFAILSFTWSWIFGAQGALAFTMAEATFLFPAPVSRTALLVMKIARTQLPVLVSATFFTYASRSVATGSRWAVLATNLLMLNAIFLDRLAAALAKCPRPATGKPHPAALAGKVVALLVIAAVAVSFRPVHLEPTVASITAAVADWANRAPARWALAPFRAFAGPALATNRHELLHALVVPGSIVLGLLLVVLFSNVSFEETALGVSESLKQRIDLIRRTGKIRQTKGRANPAPISLGPEGGPVIALAWKNYLGISRLPLGRALLYALLVILVGILIPEFEETSFLALPIGFVAAWGAGMGTFLGPDALRSDLRVSLRSADFLKTLPVRGWKIFLGEILAGPCVLIFFQGVLLGLAALVSCNEIHAVPRGTFAWGWLAGVIFLFPIDLLVFTIANGAAVLFPSWVQLGAQPERGAEVIGQNFLVGIVRYLLLAAGLVPAGGIAVLLGAIGWAFVGPVALPIAAAAGALVLFIEVGVLVAYLGSALERLDPSVELG